MTVYDALVVGGGPGGSTCARFLTRGGAKVAIVDRAEFPRVKLCAGWVSAPIWDNLELSPREYTRGLWEWHTAHVEYGGARHAIPCHGWFIRRYELDDFLLHRSGAELHLGVAVKSIERDADGLWNVGGLRAKHLIGAGGTHCPVARKLSVTRPRGPVGVQELELQVDPGAVARARVGKDGEPELLLHDDLRGYAWNIPKTDWINLGVGTMDPQEVRGAWQKARERFVVPDEAAPKLEHMKGHSYYLFDPAHLDGAAGDGISIVGDSLGLAHPLTAEGILPATVSGRLAAEALLAGDPASYVARLKAHPVLADYARVFHLREMIAKKRKNANGNGNGTPKRGKKLIARGFAWMFSGARLPAPRLIDFVLRR